MIHYNSTFFTISFLRFLNDNDNNTLNRIYIIHIVFPVAQYFSSHIYMCMRVCLYMCTEHVTYANKLYEISYNSVRTKHAYAFKLNSLKNIKTTRYGDFLHWHNISYDLSIYFSLFSIANAFVFFFHFSCGLQTNNNHSCYLICKTIRQTLVKLYCIILFNHNLLICKWQLLYVLLMLDNWLFQNMFIFIFHFITHDNVYKSTYTHTYSLKRKKL